MSGRIPVVYVAGPMTGIEDFNYPAFNLMAEHLKERGFIVENPADTPEQPNWQGYMRAGITKLMRCDAVLMLPGWQRSRGAQIEINLALSLGILVFTSLRDLPSVEEWPWPTT